MSTVAGVGASKKLEGMDDSKKRTSIHEAEEVKELKHTLKPFSAMNDSKNNKTNRALLDNISPISKGDLTVEINLRSMVNMDNEPSYFMQAFQGSLVVRTNEYLNRYP